MIVELLFTANCATVNVLHTKHPRYGDRGQYFFFDENDFTKMVGEKEWSHKHYEVIQRGSRGWTGTIEVWGGSNQIGAHGRRDTGKTGIAASPAEGKWAQGDTIQLKACGEAGI